MRSILATTARWLSTGTIAGMAGGLVAGLGSRLAMRLSGLTTGTPQVGISTEAGFTVGEVTVGGTLVLTLFCGFLGILGGLAYLSVKPWVPAVGRGRWLWFGSLLLVLFGPLVIERANPDFHLFGPSLLNLVTFSSLFPVFGFVTVRVADRLENVTWTSPLMRGTQVLSAVVGALSGWAMVRLLAVGALPSPEAEEARSLTLELVSAAFNGFAYDALNLSATQVLTVGLILYVLVVLPLVRAVAAQPGGGVRPGPSAVAHVAFALAVVAGTSLLAWEFIEIMRAVS